MTSIRTLGDFEERVLWTVHRLGEDAYGVTIRQAVSKQTKKDVAIGALYTTLNRLEEKGYVKSHFSGATPVRGGRAKKYIKITGLGIAALEEKEQVRGRLSAEFGVGQLLSGGAA